MIGFISKTNVARHDKMKSLEALSMLALSAIETD
jgi:hypothetical protein